MCPAFRNVHAYNCSSRLVESAGQLLLSWGLKSPTFGLDPFGKTERQVTRENMIWH